MDFRFGIFNFIWMKCPDGYEIVESGSAYPALEPERGKRKVKLRPVVRPRSKKVAVVHATEDYKTIHHNLAKMKHTSEGVKQFTESYGVLTGTHLRPSDEMEVDFAIRFSRALRKLNKTPFPRVRYVSGPPDTIGYFNNTFGYELGQFRIHLMHGGKGKLVYQVVPYNLTSLVILLAANELAGDIETRICANPNCDETFQVSSGRGTVTKKQVHTVRKFTCGNERCRKAVQRLRQKEKSNE
jgi:hypothetical protein